LGQLLDRIAAVEQHAVVAVDVGDRRLAAGGGGEARVVGEEARFPGQLRDVDTVVAERGFQDGQVDGLAAGVQHDFVGHGCAPHGSDVRTGPWSPATAASWLPQRSNYRTGGPEAASDFGPVGQQRAAPDRGARTVCGRGCDNADGRPKAAVWDIPERIVPFAITSRSGA